MMRLFLLCFLLALSAASAAELPARLEIAYRLTRNDSTLADITEHLEYAKGNYQLTETWKGRGLYALLGSARRVSRGTVTDTALQPHEFFDERSGRDTARAWFDWNARTLTMQYKGERKTEPLYPNPQDRLSFLLALSLLPGKAQTADYHIADGKGISHHVYRVVGPEKLQTPAGEFNTVKVAKVEDKPSNERAELWLAAELGYVPVRLLVVQEDGTRLDQVAVRVSK